jgi:thiamine-monophosphate kinase
MSGVGANLQADALPISDELRAAYPDEALGMACSGGEDYELLLVGGRERLNGLPVTRIGEIVEGSGVRLVEDGGAEIDYERKGWDAFKP